MSTDAQKMTLSGNFFNLNGNSDDDGESSWQQQCFLNNLFVPFGFWKIESWPLARGYLTQQKLTTAFELVQAEAMSSTQCEQAILSLYFLVNTIKTEKVSSRNIKGYPKEQGVS